MSEKLYQSPCYRRYVDHHVIEVMSISSCARSYVSQHVSEDMLIIIF